MSTPVVSVIIPVYNDPERLKTCLQALEEQTYPKNAYEVIVVDNGSDKSIEPIVAEFSQAKASSETHPGSYAARNTGIALARGEVLAFTDSDCIPAPDWIEKGVKHLLSVPNCGIIGGKLEPLFKDPEHPMAVELYEVIMYYCQKRFVEVMNFSVTANLFTFHHVIEKIGGFDTHLKSSGDYEWGHRVATAGYQIIYADNVKVVHPARSTLAQLRQKTIRLAGGYEDRRQKNPSSILRIYRGMVRDCFPPVLTLIRLDPSLKAKTKKKIKVLGIWFVMKYVEIKERLRLKLRIGHSVR